MKEQLQRLAKVTPAICFTLALMYLDRAMKKDCSFLVTHDSCLR